MLTGRDGTAAATAAFIAVDSASRKLLDQLKKIAPSGATVLLRGEAGVGKDLAASLLHSLGPHPDEPLLNVDCASLPPELLWSELFGDEGNGSNGTHSKRGRIELAGNGTVVLDEIAALTMPMQAKLLRLLERSEFASGKSPVRARIIALTHVDLERAVARRSFREDLYYRLSVTQFSILPLRERREDIQPLAEHFLAQLAQVHRRTKPDFAADALRALLAFSYPGNVRQLRNIVERAVITGTGPEIHEEDLPTFVRQGSDRPVMTLEELERSYIAEVLDATRGKKTKAAQILGISRKTLLEKRKRYGLG